MSNRLLRIQAVSIFLLLVTLVGSAYAQAPVKKIGVLLWTDDLRYEQGLKGFIEELKTEGFASPQVEFIIRRAGGKKVLALKYSEELAALNLDLYFSAGTSATDLLSGTIKKAPIVFTIVYDPINAGLIQGLASSKNNLTGATNSVPMDKVLELVRRIIPIKNMAVLYTPNEKNSECQLKDLQQVQAAFGISIIPVPVVNKAEIARIIPFLKGMAQSIFITGSSVVIKGLPDITDFASKNKILTVTHLGDLVAEGVMVGLCADDTEQGMLAGETAVEILKGTKPEDIPIKKAKDLVVFINRKSVNSAGISIPQDIIQKAKIF